MACLKEHAVLDICTTEHGTNLCTTLYTLANFLFLLFQFHRAPPHTAQHSELARFRYLARARARMYRQQSIQISVSLLAGGVREFHILRR